MAPTKTDFSNIASNAAKPRLIFDGDCGFCVYWAQYWQKLTGDRVDYQPYQRVASEYPNLSIDDFKRAVQYVSPTGEISSGAEASFRTLHHAPGKGGWLTLYQKLPGFAYLSETSYRFIAAHRAFFYKLSLLFYGKHYSPPQYNIISWLFLRGLGLIFLIAFISFTTQAHGLIGSHGIVPIQDLVQAANQQLGIERYWYLLMVFWLSASDLTLTLVCYGGIIASFMLIVNFLPRISLLVLYILYLSLINAGQVFMTFQWDLLLIETSLIAIVLITSQQLGIWLLRFLLFRFMFAGGLVKIFSGDPSWLNLTALNYHFYTQPLPTPIAWYAQQLPEIALMFGTAATLFIELVLVFLLFFPRRIRFFSGCSILLLQLVIFLTGNYNFFNITTMLLCLSAFDDAAIQSLLPTRLTSWIMQRTKEPFPGVTARLLTRSFAVFTISISLIQFTLRFDWHASSLAAEINNYTSPLRMVSTYGPFAVMTKNRFEIIVEGSQDGIDWREYQFIYKPGDVFKRPLWNVPFQPRLDWQMWFAALSAPENNPWFYQFLKRLLENSADVTALLKNNPFKDHPPQYVRAQFYDYHFTNRHEKAVNGAWWKREWVGSYVSGLQLK